jgi:hypothetical protein
MIGIQLEDIKEIIKNQNEMIKEQASEIGKLKTSLECTIMSRSNEDSSPRPMENKHTQCHVLFSDKHTQCHVLTSDKCSNTEDSLFLSMPPKVEVSIDTEQKEPCVAQSSTEKSTMGKPVKVQFAGSLCTFFLQGNCKKQNNCNFSHEEILVGDILEYNDTYLNCVLPTKFLGFTPPHDFEIQARLLTKSAGIVVAYPNRFRKKRNQALPT